MESKRRTQADRSAATRAALIEAARPLFAEQGYAAVGTEAIVRAAGVTRGALYHQFEDKAELFAAVFEAVEAEVMERLAAEVSAAETTDPIAALDIGADAWLRACSDPEVRRIVLLDAPAVLGWARWREISMRHGAGLVEAALQAAMEAGRVRAQPVRPLAHVVIGAMDEAALYVAQAEDPEAARAEAGAAVRSLLQGLVVD
jgi:AcrR family transcriptional regulator